MKIIDLIRERAKADEKWFSVEFYPYKTTEGVYNLFDRCDQYADVKPLFADITWGAGGSTADMSLEIATALQNYICLETQMHLTCTNMEKEAFASALIKCKENGIQNILALRGDPPRGQEKWTATDGGFEHAVDLVKFIREEHGDHFAICVAGYPEGHTEAESYDKDIEYLKQKVDAGADMIITQLFYDVKVFLDFVKDCRAEGIQCPIIPGIMPITSYQSMQKICKMSNTKVPPEVWANLEQLKDKPDEVKEYGTTYVANMCRKLLDSGVQGLHMYTMNQLGPCQAVLRKLDMLKTGKTYPWRQACDRDEDVRPIFWANRPKSYLKRTKEWEDYPQGRWGGFTPRNNNADNRTPAFGEMGNWHNLPDVDFNTKYTEWWGKEFGCERDVFNVFIKFVKGDIDRLPWNEVPLRRESHQISQDLLRLNKSGYLSINSQPRVNGADSSDEEVGWGAPGGRVYQKAYIEFFCSPDRLMKLLQVAKQFPSLTFHAINKAGDREGNGKHKVNAVTWGIFPESEVKQPTVVDPEALMSWKSEAFSLWENQWLSLYDNETDSYKVLSNMIETYYLVTLVDNAFYDDESDIFMIFARSAEVI